MHSAELIRVCGFRIRENERQFNIGLSLLNESFTRPRFGVAILFMTFVCQQFGLVIS